MTEARAMALKSAQAITAERGATKVKSRQREKAAHEKWLNESIKIQLLDGEGRELDGCTWKVQRRRLTVEFLQGMLDRSKVKDAKVDCLREQKTQEVIWPEEMQQRCLSHRQATYFLLPRWPQYPFDMIHDAHYQGDYGLALYDVPLRTDDDHTDVTKMDVRAWVVAAILEEDKKAKRIMDKIAQIEAEMKETEGQMSRVSRMKFDHMSADKQDQERENTYKNLEGRRDEQGSILELHKRKLRFHHHLRAGVEMHMTQGNVDESAATCNWYIRFTGSEEKQLMDDLLKKYDWNGIRLAVGDRQNPPWCGRGKVPDGNKSYQVDYTQNTVNMRGVKIARLAHGFGTYRMLATDGTPVSGDHFEFHHGHWVANKREGIGVQYTDEGIYAGGFADNTRNGTGRFVTAVGDTIEGTFAYQLRHKPSKLRPNPFAVGVPDGPMIKITFADGAVYEGPMAAGKIMGKGGKYVSSLGEVVQGEFLEGKLHGEGRVESASGEVFTGLWQDGYLNGDGKWDGADGEHYKGSFTRGYKSGRGVERYRNGNFYRGFYKNGWRMGRGTMFYGHVVDELNKQGEQVLEYDCRMDCNWFAGYMRARGVNHYDRSGNSFYTFNRCSPWYPFVSGLNNVEERHAKTLKKHRKRQTFMCEHVRRGIENAKLIGYLHCLKLAARMVKKDLPVHGLTAKDVEKIHADRKGAAEHALRRHRIVNGDPVLQDLQLAVDVRRVEEAAHQMRYASCNATALSEALKLVFEGSEERLRILSTPLTLMEFMTKAEQQANELGL